MLRMPGWRVRGGGGACSRKLRCAGACRASRSSAKGRMGRWSRSWFLTMLTRVVRIRRVRSSARERLRSARLRAWSRVRESSCASRVSAAGVGRERSLRAARRGSGDRVRLGATGWLRSHLAPDAHRPGGPLLDRIVVNPEDVHVRPAACGTRDRCALAAGASLAQILEESPYLPEDDITACLACAAAQADHPILVAP